MYHGVVWLHKRDRREHTTRTATLDAIHLPHKCSVVHVVVVKHREKNFEH